MNAYKKLRKRARRGGTFAPWRIGPIFVTLLVLFAGMVAVANAAARPVEVSLNGGSPWEWQYNETTPALQESGTPVFVPVGGGNLTVNVKIDVGSFGEDSWKSTRLQFYNGDTAVGSSVCFNNVDTSTDGVNYDFDITTPSAAGVYGLRVIAYNTSNECSGGDPVTVTANSAVVVGGTNPNLTPGCALDIIFILDESTSISSDGAITNVRNAMKAIVDALEGSGSYMAVVEFGTVARRAVIGGSNDYKLVDASYSTAFNTYIDTNGSVGTGGNANYDPSSGINYTNWEDSFIKAIDIGPREIAPGVDGPAPLIIFMTDGVPNRYILANGSTGGNTTDFNPIALSEAWGQATTLRNNGSHIFGTGFGQILTALDALNNLKAVTGPDNFASGPTAGNFLTSDYYVNANPAQLAAALKQAFASVCAPSLTVTKMVDGAPADNWEFTAKVEMDEDGVAVSNYEWTNPVLGTAGSPDNKGITQVDETSGGGVSQWEWKPGNATTPQPWDSLVTFWEEDRDGYMFAGGSCVISTVNEDGSVSDSNIAIGSIYQADPMELTLASNQYARCVVYNEAPEITVTKTADPTTVPETGGPVTFTYEVKNTGNVPVTITELDDDKFNELDGDANCQIGTELEPDESCTFSEVFDVPAGPTNGSHTNIFTAKAEDEEENEAEDSDDATVNYTDVLPLIEVEKSADPTSVPQTGGNVTFTFVVTNVGDVPVTITDLDDDKFNELDGDDDCKVGTILQPEDSCSFSEVFPVPAGPVDGSHENTFTAKAEDDDDNEVEDSDNAIVTYTPVIPGISVTKTADQSAVYSGDEVEFTVTVANTGDGPITVSTLVDSVYGDIVDPLNTNIVSTTCDLDSAVVIAEGGDPYECTFTAVVSGDPGTTHSNTVTVCDTTKEPDLCAEDPEDVNILNPAIKVTKNADKSAVYSGDQVVFTVKVENTGTGPITVSTLVDSVYGDIVDPLNTNIVSTTCDLDSAVVIAEGGDPYECTFTAVVSGQPNTTHTNTVEACDTTKEPDLCAEDPADVDILPLVTSMCPVEGVSNTWTDILGIGMGNPKKHKNVAKIVIPNSANVVELYGQLVAKQEGLPNYVRFIYPGKKNWLQEYNITSQAARQSSVFWYGAELDPNVKNVRGRWFLQKTGTKKHIPRAFILYPTYIDHNREWVNVFETMDSHDTQVYWDEPNNWVQTQMFYISIPAPLMPATFNVKVALVDNDKDKRPVFLTVSAGGVSSVAQPTAPNKGDQLNIIEFTLENVPAGTSEIEFKLFSPSPYTHGLDAFGGDSAAITGITANYECIDYQ